MPMSVDHCWTTHNLCTNGDVDLLQRHLYSPISDWWHRFMLEYGDQLHLSRLFNSQHLIYGIHKISNSLANLKSICSPINCICNIDFLWSKFPVKILYSLSSKVKLFKGCECLTNSFNVQCLFYPAFSLLASSPSICFEPLSFLLLFCCFSG